MSYNPTTWNTGDIVTSEKLNKMEQGIANAGVLVCHVVEENETTRLDHTWQEIVDAGFAVAIVPADAGQFETNPLAGYGESEGTKYCVFGTLVNSSKFDCENASDYPVLTPSISGGSSNPSIN